jgi:hypothetical protein
MCTNLEDSKGMNFTVGGMCGEYYFFYNTKQEAKEHLIELL